MCLLNLLFALAFLIKTKKMLMNWIISDNIVNIIWRFRLILCTYPHTYTHTTRHNILTIPLQITIHNLFNKWHKKIIYIYEEDNEWNSILMVIYHQAVVVAIENENASKRAKKHLPNTDCPHICSLLLHFSLMWQNNIVHCSSVSHSIVCYAYRLI